MASGGEQGAGADQAARAGEIAEALLKAAKAAGADAADVVTSASEAMNVDARGGALEGVERDESLEFGLRVMIAGDPDGLRGASVSASDPTPAVLETLAARAVAMAREAPPDRYLGLADETLSAEDAAAAVASLDLLDHAPLPSPEDLLRTAIALEAAALNVDGVDQAEGAGASWRRGALHLATSDGFSAGYVATSHSIGVSAVAGSVGSNTGMERDYAFSAARRRVDLRDVDAIGREAGERAVRRLAPRKPKTGAYPIVFEPRVAASFVSSILAAANGAAVARRSSWLQERMGERLLPAGMSVIDDPLRADGLGARPFDGEGVGGRAKRIVDDGVLTEWLLDSAAARQLGLESNGSASRGVAGAPSPSSSNAWLTPGEKSFEALIADIGEGLLVTEMMGRGLNAVTGDFSSGASGFWIEKGEIAHPVSELTIAGRLFEMFESLSAANDLRFDHRVNAPSLRIEGMTVAAA